MTNLLGLNRLNITIPSAGVLRIISGAIVTVYNTNPDRTSPVTIGGVVSVGAVKTTLYASRDKSVSKANPIVADIQGLIEFYADVTEVHLLITTPDGITYGIPWLPVSSIDKPDLDVRMFGAVGDGVTDDTAAILATIAALPANGGIVYFPDLDFLISQTIAPPRNVQLIGAGYLEDETIVAKGTRIIKAATMNGTGIILSPCSTLEDITVTGITGNGGDGVQLKGNNVVIKNVSIFKQGGNGLRIGDDAVFNCNHWRLYNVTCRANVGHGCYIHSNTAAPVGSIDANAGGAFGINCNLNGGDGIRIGNSSYNTFHGHSSSNTGYGIRLAGPRAQINTFINVYAENNTAGGVIIDNALCVDNFFFGKIPNTGTFTDIAGARTIRIHTANWQLPQQDGEFLANGPVGGTFNAGTSGYMQLYASAAARIRFGWSEPGPATGLIPAQVIADANTLYLASRDTAAGKVKIMAQTGLANYILLDPQNSKVEVSSGLSMLILGGFIQVTEIADPSAPAVNNARLYIRDNGSGKSQLCVRFNNGIVPIALEP